MLCTPPAGCRSARSLPLLSLFVLLVLCAVPAQATVEYPAVILRPEIPTRALAEGESFSIPVDIYVREDASIEDVSFRSDLGAAALSFESRPVLERTAVAPGYRHERRLLEGRLEPGLDRVRLQVTVDGEVWEEALSLRGFGDPVAEDTEVALARSIDDVWLDPADHPRPDPVASGYPVAEASLARAPRTVNVSGRIVMRIRDIGADRGVDGATVYFMQVRGILDDLELGRTTTDVNGNFNFNVSMDGTHDVYVKVRCINSVINVGTDAGFQTYGRNLPTTRNFSGSNFNVGTRRFTGDFNHALWLTSTYTRSHRWYLGRGFNLPSVNCRWRDDILGSSVYLPILGLEGIHLRSSATWSARTVVHEYGHHFVAASPAQEVWPPFYTNGICDPGHCGTCPENEAVAWSEGLPHFLQQVINADHASTYGWSQPSTRNYETVGTCTQTGNFGENAPSTEDFLAALLNDIIDTNPDGSTLAPGIVENLDLTIADVLYVATSARGSDSLEFVEDFRNYLGAGLFSDEVRQEFWAAAAVNGFASDSVPPTPPTISVPTHPVGVPSASNLPYIVLGGATDAESGVASYRVEISTAPSTPGGGALVSTESSLVWPTPLGEGTFYVNAVAVDRAGNESSSVSRQIMVGPSLPLDLVDFRPDFWEDSVLLRHDTSVNASAGAVQPQLVGGTDYWVSLSARNESVSSGAVVPFNNFISVDGNVLTNGPFADTVMGSYEEYQLLNVGPNQLVGGRHHFGIHIDGGQVIAEDDNVNNRVDRYVVFRPSILAPGSWQSFPLPPRAYTTGIHAIQSYPNVSGHRVAPANQYAGVMMATADLRTDYALRMHPISTAFDNGFETPLAVSDTDQGQAETIVFNRSALGAASFDFGVERRALGSLTNYSMRHVSSQTSGPGSNLTINWTDQDDLSLVEYFFTVIDTGPFTVQVDVDFAPSDSYREVSLFWMEPGDALVRPLVDTPDLVTDSDGRGTLNVNVPSSGNYCLVAFRDTRLGGPAPKAPGGLARSAPQAATITLTTDSTPRVDFGFYQGNEFWDMPFIPSFEPLFGPKLGVPSELFGDGFSTYLNFAVENLGTLDASELVVIADLDGVVGQQFYWNSLDGLNAGSSLSFYDQNPVFVPGGRHTMTLQIDPYEQVEEIDESNNRLSVQFGWQGPELSLFSNTTMSAPPDPEAGLADLELFTAPVGFDGEDPRNLPVNYAGLNSDGFRVPQTLQKGGFGQWMAVATMPGANSNVDLRLHEVLPPAQAFTNAYVESQWGLGESDFVLVDKHAAGDEAYDVSVINAGGNENYTLVSLLATPLTDVQGSLTSYGQFGMDGGGFLSLYEVSLDPGFYQIELQPQSNDADMGLSVFFPTAPLQQPYFTKDQGRDQYPMSYDAPAGQSEKVEFEVRPGEEGVFCIAAWKVGAADLAANQDYFLQVQFIPADPECVRIDGTADQAYGDALSVQTLQTQFGDANVGLVDEANGSELDQAFGRVCDGTLFLTFAGNLESNYNDLEIFIDSRPGGQNRLLGNNADFNGEYDLNRMGDDGTGNGLTFHPLFEPDWWFGVQGGFGESTSGVPYKLAAYQAELLTNGGGPGAFLGFTSAGSRGILTGFGADNPSGIRVAIDNSNVGGVDAGIGVGSGAGVITGVELAIPLNTIGSPTDCLRVMAFVNGRWHDFLSNQALPPLPNGTPILGEPRNVDFSFVGDRHWFNVCQGAVTDVGDDVPTPVSRDVVLHQPSPNPFNPRTNVAFELPRATEVELTLYDLSGRRVRTLIAGTSLDAGRHEIVWDGSDDNGRRVASGAYLVRLMADEAQQVRRVMLLK